MCGAWRSDTLGAGGRPPALPPLPAAAAARSRCRCLPHRASVGSTRPAPGPVPASCTPTTAPACAPQTPCPWTWPGGLAAPANPRAFRRRCEPRAASLHAPQLLRGTPPACLCPASLLPSPRCLYRSELLSGTRSSRLYRSLVLSGQALAASAYAGLPADKHPCHFVCFGVPTKQRCDEPGFEQLGQGRWWKEPRKPRPLVAGMCRAAVVASFGPPVPHCIPSCTCLPPPCLPPSPTHPTPACSSIEQLDAAISAQVADLAGRGPTQDELRRYKKVQGRPLPLPGCLLCAAWASAFAPLPPPHHKHAHSYTLQCI
jgi:hypothetical protein